MARKFTLSPLPGLPGFCEQFRIRAQEKLRPYASGRHIQLWRGHSLEFRDYAPYIRGDDIRHVDWRASYRSGKKDEWLIRRFQAEEGWNVIVSVDNSESMYLPTLFPKISMAAWAAEAIARIALCSDDRVYIHRLFGMPRPLASFQSTSALPRVFSTLREFVKESAPENSKMNLSQLRGSFFTNAALIILSDFYFTDQQTYLQEMASFIRATEQGWRWVILVNLNSWPFEAWQLAEKTAGSSHRVFGPGTQEVIECDATAETLKIIEQNIDTCQKSFLQAMQRENFDLKWDWVHGPVADPLQFFEKCFTLHSSHGEKQQNPFYQLFIRQR